MKKRLSLILMAAVLSLSVVACGTGKTTEQDAKKMETTEATAKADPAFDVEITDEMKEAAKEFTVGMVTDTGGIDDKSFNQGTWEGVKKFSEMTGVKATYAQSNSDADYIPNLSTLAEEDSDLVVAAGFLFEDSIRQVAAEKPDTNFLIIDQPIPGMKNVASAEFAAQEASYLVGVAAAETAKAAGKTKVGFIGGGDFPLIQTFEAGFESGVKSVDKSIEILIDYVGDFTDSGKGQSMAAKMYDEGAYVIFHAAGGAGNGLIKEAKDRRTNNQDVWAIGVDKDQYEDGIYADGKSAILTSMVKRVDVAAFDVAIRSLKGEFPGGQNLLYNIANNGVGIPSENPNLSEDVVKKLEEVKENIKSGKEVPTTVPTRISKK